MVNTVLFSLCLVVLILIWTKNLLIFRRRAFFWFSHTFGPKTHWFCSEDLVFWFSPISGTKKSATTKSPRVPPFLASLLEMIEGSKPCYAIYSLSELTNGNICWVSSVYKVTIGCMPFIQSDVITKQPIVVALATSKTYYVFVLKNWIGSQKQQRNQQIVCKTIWSVFRKFKN